MLNVDNAADVLKILELPENKYIYNKVNNIKFYNGDTQYIYENFASKEVIYLE